MSDPAASADTTPPASPAAEDARLQQDLRALLDIAAKLVGELAADPALSAADKAEPFERYARTIRRTVALARHIAEHPTLAPPSALERHNQARRQVVRELEDAIVARVSPPEQVESLREELAERLDDPVFDRDLATRPTVDIIRDLKRDLGLAGGYFVRRTPAHIRDLYARAAAPGRPAPTPETEPESDDPEDDPLQDYEPGRLRLNALLARYREAADG